MISYLLAATLLFSGDLHIETTDIFQRMDVDEIAVREDGAVYILNFDESRIQYYDAEGKLIKNIGKRGQGPGEFTFPTYFRFADNHLFIYDELSGKISIFDKEGTFLKQVTLPARGLRMVRGSGGWFTWTTEPGHGKAGQVAFSKDEFATEQNAAKLPDVVWFNQGLRINNNNGEIEGQYSPLSLAPMLAVAPDGNTIYLVPDPRKFEVKVIDGATGKITGTIRKDAKPVPFDTEWAQEQFADSAQFLKREGIGEGKIKKNFPDFFPIIREIRTDPKGNLVVNRWRGRPDDNDYSITLDRDGNEGDNPYSWRELQRIAGFVGSHGYVVTYDGDEAGLARVPQAEVKAFLEGHPIEDWSRSRSISISR
ncbi:6-bladed beta-propeller [Acanthopleuribacter pedis]|uniref:6-bladed beta-propeller n=1 Tax=Acanthopleuribacter pedis TaxID=442870 RepID=A0A8J7U5L7_9BACT|nr:6-bladed beta-propeller [Acanthopleuribacter pedis]MBO1320984.1 6-bladed beta-propeller [Acanthopleuribacter pedis]